MNTTPDAPKVVIVWDGPARPLNLTIPEDPTIGLILDDEGRKFRITKIFKNNTQGNPHVTLLPDGVIIILVTKVN